MFEIDLLDLDEILETIDKNDKFKMEVFFYLRDIYPRYRIFIDIGKDDRRENRNRDLAILAQIQAVSTQIQLCYGILLME